MGNIIELNELIYVDAKLVCKKISILLRNPTRNTKTGLEIKRVKQEKICNIKRKC